MLNHFKNLKYLLFRSVTLNTTYVFHEMNKGTPDAAKVWISRGYMVDKWMPLVDQSLDIKNWKIKNSHVFIQEMSGDLDILNTI